MHLRVWPVLLAVCFAHGADAQLTRSVLDGVFTEAQVSRGEEAYSSNCSECHDGADVDGPPLEGTPFVDRWREDNLNVLFTFIKTSMPANKPGDLSDETYLDILAHLLKMNGYPSSTRMESFLSTARFPLSKLVHGSRSTEPTWQTELSSGTAASRHL